MLTGSHQGYQQESDSSDGLSSDSEGSSDVLGLWFFGGFFRGSLKGFLTGYFGGYLEIVQGLLTWGLFKGYFGLF